MAVVACARHGWTTQPHLGLAASWEQTSPTSYTFKLRSDAKFSNGRPVTAADVAGLPRTVISVNECDPLRDEGLNFYRLLLKAGVPARGRQIMGTMHGTEIFGIACPEISHDTARDLAAFARG